MDTDVANGELTARLKRLDASAAATHPGFDYEGLIGRHAASQARARRRLAYARGTASALVIALVGAGIWRFDQPPVPQRAANVATPVVNEQLSQPRIVRADTYLAVAALEDHIASLDDALNVARQIAPRGAEVARLERTRAELVDSYTQVRYAELVSANF
ncbi:MAG TPA: hypothetical protein VGO61_16305 [Steroidobacteraceae bacterium]|jgi:hypothetical protein|nr:hypothetical protein [Steroidobacteraceae bacterium]